MAVVIQLDGPATTRIASLSSGSRHDFLLDLVGQRVIRSLQIVGGLNVHFIHI
jgi:hypothetical protein